MSGTEQGQTQRDSFLWRMYLECVGLDGGGVEGVFKIPHPRSGPRPLVSPGRDGPRSCPHHARAHSNRNVQTHSDPQESVLFIGNQFSIL